MSASKSTPVRRHDRQDHRRLKPWWPRARKNRPPVRPISWSYCSTTVGFSDFGCLRLVHQDADHRQARRRRPALISGFHTTAMLLRTTRAALLTGDAPSFVSASAASRPFRLWLSRLSRQDRAVRRGTLGGDASRPTPIAPTWSANGM